MRIIEDNCVGCPQGCIRCGRSHQEVIKCDSVNCEEYATYTTEDGDYCDDCLQTELDAIYSSLSLSEKIALLKEHITVERI